MVTRLDRHVGQIIKVVRDLGLEGRTIFIFTSDNGPVFDSLSGERTDFFNSAGGLRGRKGTLWEGGIREPTLVAWKGKITPGTTSDRVVGIEDWLPTLLELAGGKSATPTDIDGISCAPTLLGRDQAPRPFLYRVFGTGGGQQIVRIGDWKGVRMNMQPGGGKGKAKSKSTAKAAADSPPNLKVQLYNLKTDPAETTDVADKHPEIVARIEKIMRQEHTPSPEFPLPGIDG
jgi:arylsulfatase A-like enzyme